VWLAEGFYSELGFQGQEVPVVYRQDRNNNRKELLVPSKQLTRIHLKILFEPKQDSFTFSIIERNSSNNSPPGVDQSAE
jgi:hypothetical protein